MRLTWPGGAFGVEIADTPLILSVMKALTRLTLPVVFALLFAPPAGADEPLDAADTPLIIPSGTSDLSEFVWKKRPVVVFADTENDPAFIEQMDFIRSRPDALVERDVIVVTDTDAATLSPLRRKLRPRGFMLVIIDKEGVIQQRKPFPQDVREIGRNIDKLPIRQREIRDGNAPTAAGG